MKKIIGVLFCLNLFFYGFYQLALGQSGDNNSTNPFYLRELINQKNAELQAIMEQRETLEKTLKDISESGNSLKREINSINYQINQLDLAIKANKIAVEKLELEIESLARNINQIEDNIENRKNSISKLFVELQQRDNENLLVILLKNQSLAQTVSEAQEIISLNNSLAKEMEELRDFKIELAQRLNESKEKHQSRTLEKTNLINRQLIIQDQKKVKQTILAQTKNQEKIYQAKIEELERKQEEISAVIEEIEKKLRESFDPSLLPSKRPGVIGFPVENPVITQTYGPTSFAQRAYRTKFHNGVDFKAALGTPVFAVAEGKVIAVDNNDIGVSRWQKFQYGRYILIEHDNNLSSLYAHLSRSIVRKNDIIKKGELIGYSGDTGYSMGPHVHLSIYWSPSLQFKSIPPAGGLVPVGVIINPLDYLPTL